MLVYQLAQKHESEIFVLLESKDLPALDLLTKDFQPVIRQALLDLPSLYGDFSVIEKARKKLPQLEGITNALNELEYLLKLAGNAVVTIDLADLRGYHYHSGVMFNVFVPGLPNPVARGGRYDHVGEAFGRARPATGFSLDLRELARLMPIAERKNEILAPWSQDEALKKKIVELRRSGEVVIQSLPGHENDHDEFDCKRMLVLSGHEWILNSVA
jgi:ATP phosphoribosyltransferase regulatory subunit